MSIIEIIKERLYIEDIISRYLPLAKSGKNLRGLCPFHNEQTPSFFVFPDSQRYKCFGCGAGGDLFDFVMQREGWDVPLWIDDYTPQSTFQGMNELKGKVDQLLRDWGNRSGRARMRADLQLRQTFAPRGLIIGTAEQLPPGQSIQARLFQVEVHPEMITRGADSPLTKAQTEDAPLYPHAMAGYVQWLAEQWETLTEALPDRLLTYTEAAREKGAHLRMPNNVATLFLGWELFLDYCLQRKVVTDAEYADLRDLGWTVLIALGEAQQDVAQEEKPVELYLTALRQLLHQGTLYLRSREYPDLVDQEYPKLSVRAANAEFVGWYDDQYIYLLSKVALRVVHKFYRDTDFTDFTTFVEGVEAYRSKKKGILTLTRHRARGHSRIRRGCLCRVRFRQNEI